MIHTIIEKNNYQDSIVLMLLTNHLEEMPGVTSISVMMGTPANKDIFKTGGLYTPELEDATANDMVIVADVENQATIDELVKEAKTYLEEQASKNQSGATQERVKTWDKAYRLGEDASVSILSIPGTHAALEIEKALDAGKHVFCFSDNVSVEDERRLKQQAHQQGLLLMGPDCGTGIINGIPLAFTNAVRKGKIGVIGASGTGIQEVTTIIHRLGEGVTHAIGTGGRDLKEEIGGTTFKDSIALLEQDPEVQVIVAISKPPAKAIRDEVLDLLRASKKPVVSIFLGENPESHEENLFHAHTLEETAKIAVALLRGTNPTLIEEETLAVPSVKLAANQRTIKGYYSGGTLAYEAGMLVKEAFGIQSTTAAEGFILAAEGHEIIDLGDDIYTNGKPHPMIDPTIRKEMLAAAAKDETTAVVLLDVVLGYGAHDDMASELAPMIKQIQAEAVEKGRQIAVVATIVGTDEDPQSIVEQENILKDAGVILCESNAQAVKLALAIVDHPVTEEKKPVHAKAATTVEIPVVSQRLGQLLSADKFINIGLSSFTKAITDYGGKVVQYDWQPVAGGNVELQKAIHYLKKVSLKVEG
ncbi:acyl-CoA synthetase FdrA [Enterococcus sp. JM4C]|uniref:acyl-CoA synthetase FdrA n=1 Tax=Candidatus Enterococcus huntleyi TaxID=1857217 RepID=UPI00137AF9A9|nr:acyl-CoA synthetase FdrA [Enterococcus sp. JM4C]KAF1299228.1 acyl-CoA synthetase FdrA [Enterococcus sp. JM4C]